MQTGAFGCFKVQTMPLKADERQCDSKKAPRFCLPIKSPFVTVPPDKATPTDNLKTTLLWSMAEACEHENATQIYTRFLYKALAVAVFLIFVSLLPSQAPEFINQTMKTRGWEFLHLLFVGIAVSYGLFCGRTEGEAREGKGGNSKFEYVHSFLARFLPSSSVFGDGEESPVISDGDKVEAWTNQYYRNDAVDLAVDEPLLLPVRRLKSHPIDGDRGSDGEKGENVLPAPSPWKSLASKMEIQETEDASENKKKKTTDRAHPPPLFPPRSPLQTIRKSVSHYNSNEKGSIHNNLKRSNTAEYDRGKSNKVESDENNREEIQVTAQKNFLSTRLLNPQKTTYIPNPNPPDSEDEEETAKPSVPASNPNIDEAPDVDQKAEEFIAKFREQIRLQRIESIKLYSISQSTVNSLR